MRVCACAREPGAANQPVHFTVGETLVFLCVCHSIWLCVVTPVPAPPLPSMRARSLFFLSLQRHLIQSIRLCGPRYWEYALECTPSAGGSPVPGLCSIQYRLSETVRSGKGSMVLWARRKRAQLPYHDDPQGKCNLLAGALPPVEPPSCLAALCRLKTRWLTKSGHEHSDGSGDDEDEEEESEEEEEEDEEAAGGAAGPGGSLFDEELLTSYTKDPSVVLLMSVLSGRGESANGSEAAFAVDPAVLFQLVAEVRECLCACVGACCVLVSAVMCVCQGLCCACACMCVCFVCFVCLCLPVVHSCRWFRTCVRDCAVLFPLFSLPWCWVSRRKRESCRCTLLLPRWWAALARHRTVLGLPTSPSWPPIGTSCGAAVDPVTGAASTLTRHL